MMQDTLFYVALTVVINFLGNCQPNVRQLSKKYMAIANQL